MGKDVKNEHAYVRASLPSFYHSGDLVQSIEKSFVANLEGILWKKLKADPCSGIDKLPVWDSVDRQLRDFGMTYNVDSGFAVRVVDSAIAALGDLHDNGHACLIPGPSWRQRFAVKN